MSIFDSLKSHLYNTGLYKLHYLTKLSNVDVLKRCCDIMSEDQKIIFKDITENDDKIFNCVGLPGTGKSFLQDTIHAYYELENSKKRNIDVIVVAPTNQIALQQNGITLNQAIKKFCYSYLKQNNFQIDENIAKLLTPKNINLKNASLTDLVYYIQNLSKNDINMYFKKYFDYDKQYVVLVDEGSMISSLSFATLLAAYPFESTKFIVFLGPNQLPPVSPQLNLKCYFDIEWGEKYKKIVHTLHTQMRFKDESQRVFREYVDLYNDYLNKKCIDEKKVAYFQENLTIGGCLKDYHDSQDDDKILIVATNEIDKIYCYHEGVVYLQRLHIPVLGESNCCSEE